MFIIINIINNITNVPEYIVKNCYTKCSTKCITKYPRMPLLGFSKEVNSKNKKPLKSLFKGVSRGFKCARDRNRTDTAFTGNRILSPARLPIPPLGLYNYKEH